MADKLEQPTTRMVVLAVVLKCSVRLLMRSDRIATCTSGDPVSPGFLAYVLITSALRPAVTDIGLPFLSRGSAHQAGKVEHALGDDFATIQLGKGQQAARCRDIDCAAEIGGVPSAQQNGLASLKPCRVCSADGQRRDVVQRGLNGHQSIREARLAGRGSMA